MKLGLWVFALSSMFAGLFDLIWREFEPAHQPMRAFADPLPGEPALATIGGLLLLLGGAALLIPRTRRMGAIASGAMYLLFATCWVYRFYTATKALGLHFVVLEGVAGMLFLELLLVSGAWIAYGWAGSETELSRAVQGSRWIVGTGSILFGLAHLLGTKFVAQMMPAWFPLGGPFWVIVTGIAFVLAGVAILARVQDVLAARMLALMLLIFSIALLTPNIIANPHNHVTWGSNACNLTAAGAVFLFSEALAARKAVAKPFASVGVKVAA